MQGKDYSRLIKPYESFMRNLGLDVQYNGSKPDDSEVLLLIKIPNPDNPNDFSLAFYQVFTDAPLSMEGFERRVVGKESTPETRDQFAKDVINRIKGCTVSKSDVVFRLLETRLYTIDQIYGGGELHLTPSMIKEVSAWRNFKGGRNPMTREEIRKVLGS